LYTGIVYPQRQRVATCRTQARSTLLLPSSLPQRLSTSMCGGWRVWARENGACDLLSKHRVREGGVGLWGSSGAGHVVSEEAPFTYHHPFSMTSAISAPSRNHVTRRPRPLHHQLRQARLSFVFAQVVAFVLGLLLSRNAHGCTMN
jgi:hypothetical protein